MANVGAPRRDRARVRSARWGSSRGTIADCRTNESKMNVTEKQIDDETLDSIREYAQEAAEWLEIGLTDELKPEDIVAAVDQRVHEIQKQGPGEDAEKTADTNEEAALTLASLWGEQLVRHLGWHWAKIAFHDHDDAEAIGVFSPDRSLAIYPFHFVFSCFEDGVPVTILLAFDVLSDGQRVPDLPKRGYENVMDNVHHVIPRD